MSAQNFFGGQFFGGDFFATGGAAPIGGSKRKIRGPYSDPRIYEDYIKRCIAEREAANRPIEVAVLKDALVAEVEKREQFEYSERDALIRENQILKRLLALAKAKRDVAAMLARQKQIQEQIEEFEEQEAGALLALFDDMED